MVIEKTKSAIKMYIDGFRSMTVGKSLWKIIFIKLIIMFAVLKIFFFPNFLNSKFDTPSEKAGYVLDQITKTNHREVKHE